MADREALKRRLARAKELGPIDPNETNDDEESEFGTATEPTSITATNLRRKSRPKI